MTDPVPPASDIPDRRHNARLVRTLLPGFTPAFLVSLACGLACYSSAGKTLGVFLGPIVFAPLLAPALTTSEERVVGRLSAMVGVIAGVTVVWAGLWFDGLVRWENFLQITSVLTAWVVGLSAVAVFLREARLPTVLACALTSTLALVWLTWPIWLSPVLAGHDRGLTGLAELSPLLSANWTVEHLGLWSSPMSGSELAYKYLTNLNQDVAYPGSRHLYPVWLVYGFGGGMLLAAGLFLGARRRRLRHELRVTAL